MTMTIRATKTEQNQRIVKEYVEEFGVTDIDPDELTAWAIETDRFEDEPTNFFRKAKRELIKAMRDEHYTDPQGREVRKKIAIRIKGEKRQRSLWFDMLGAKPKKAHVALSQQRRGILAHCRKHKLMIDSYNDNNEHGAQLPLFDYNFNKDLKEEQLPTSYPDAPPVEDDD